MASSAWKRSVTVVALSAGTLIGFAGTSSAVLPAEQSMKDTPDSVIIGTKVKFGGTLSGMRDRPIADQEVALQRRVGDGDWSVAKTGKTNDDGAVSFSVAVDRTSQWRLSYGGGYVYDPAASKAQTVEAHKPPPPPAPPKGQQIVSLAAKQAGKPYSYGAEGPKAFDCSGLTSYVHKLAGITLPRTSDDQRAATRHVAQDAKQPGDLIFFADGGSVYHAGIYAGGNQMWAAPESGDVVRKQDIWTSAYSVGRAW